MGKNNTLYKLFQDMFSNYSNGNSIEREAYCLMCTYGENIEYPFIEGSKENEHLGEMYLCYARWKNGGPEAKFNYKKMVIAANELCKLNPSNPYSFSKEEEKEELEEQKRLEKLKQRELAEEQKRLEEELKKQELLKKQEELKKKEESEKIILEENQTVLGVIPDEEQEKEKKNWFKFLFPWKKDGE